MTYDRLVLHVLDNTKHELSISSIDAGLRGGSSVILNGSGRSIGRHVEVAEKVSVT